jgi:group I intron endonuclease
MKISGIYKILNKISGRFYIGSSADIKNRWVSHKKMLRKNRHDNQHLQNSWNKYGESNFDFLILNECSNPELLITEQKYLDDKSIRDNLYNLSFIAGKIEMTDEIKKKISDGNKGKIVSEETKKLLSDINSGSNHPMFGKPNNANLGKKFSKDWCNKIGDGNRGKVVSEETKQKIRNSLLGRKLSEETKQKMRKPKNII